MENRAWYIDAPDYGGPRPGSAVTLWVDEGTFVNLTVAALAVCSWDDFAKMKIDFAEIEKQGFHLSHFWQWSLLAKMFEREIRVSSWKNGDMRVFVTFWPDGTLQFDGRHHGRWLARYAGEQTGPNGKFPRRPVRDGEICHVP